MANVPTDEMQADEVVPLSVTAIRDAIVSFIPKDENIVSDVKIQDGLADVLIRWRGLRWATLIAVQDQTPEQIGEKVDVEFRTWLKATIKNMNEIPRHARVLHEMTQWLNGNPDKRAWLYQEPRNKTDFAGLNEEAA